VIVASCSGPEPDSEQEADMAEVAFAVPVHPACEAILDAPGLDLTQPPPPPDVVVDYRA
jgi:hypothetical protein